MTARLMRTLGFPTTMRIMAALLVGLLLLANILVRSRLTHTRKPFQFIALIQGRQRDGERMGLGKGIL